MCLTFGMLFYVLFFPLGISFREIGNITGLVGLAVVLLCDYRQSNVRLYPFKWSYFVFIALIIFKIFHSEYSGAGYYALRTNWYKGFLIFFLAMEFVNSEKNVRYLIFAFAIMGFYEGVVGVVQGIDLINLGPEGPLFKHRLVGTFSSARVGNLLAIVLPITFVLPVALPRKWPTWVRWATAVTVWLPMLFLLFGAGTRTGYIGVVVSCLAFLVIRGGASLFFVLGGALVLLGLIFAAPERWAWEVISHDNRVVDVWPIALSVFREFPLLGSGIDTYDVVHRSMGLFPKVMKQLPHHPHNIYLQFLCETGVVGFVIFIQYLFFPVWWLYLNIKNRVKCIRSSSNWIYAAAFLSSYVGYLASGFTGHNYFRSWWLGISMLVLGAAIGICLHSLRTVDNKS